MNADSPQSLPYVEPLPDIVTAVDAFRRLAALPRVLFLDSAARDDRLGRYSFVAADPFEWIALNPPPLKGGARGGIPDGRITQDNEQTDSLSAVEQRWRRYHALSTPNPNLPPFQGGVAGLFGYELNRSLEYIPAARYDDLPTAALAVGAYDVVLAFDHLQRRGWLISQGFPETEPAARRERAAARAAEFRQLITSPTPPTACGLASNDNPQASLAPQYPVAIPGVTSNLSAAQYRDMVRRGVEYIHAGDVFQVNLAQRLLLPATAPSLDAYLRLRERNPAPYAGYLDLGDAQVCSASPECFLTVRDRQVETRPIKGTRGRSHLPEADLYAGDELSASEKDRAENVMIVDLMRNDLSRVCTPDSVHVAQLCRLETYAFVKHLVSVVRGELRPECSPVDLLRASFPGGSITGAPKVRAMEIIAELEPTARGPYCGSLGYLGFDGQMDLSILIRTMTASGGWWQVPVGGGIVAQSDPGDEYNETWHKARGMLRALL
jgi:para-aminobenzoate synthetase component I